MLLLEALFRHVTLWSIEEQIQNCGHYLKAKLLDLFSCSLTMANVLAIIKITTFNHMVSTILVSFFHPVSSLWSSTLMLGHMYKPVGSGPSVDSLWQNLHPSLLNTDLLLTQKSVLFFNFFHFVPEKDPVLTPALSLEGCGAAEWRSPQVMLHMACSLLRSIKCQL